MHKKITSALLTLLLASTVGITNPAHAGLNISDNPLFVSVSVPPNVMFTLDDSGSMQWEYMPDGGGMDFSTFMFPRLEHSTGATTTATRSMQLSTTRTSISTGAPANNGVFYNPDLTYSPWSRPDGTEMPPADPTNAPRSELVWVADFRTTWYYDWKRLLVAGPAGIRLALSVRSVYCGNVTVTGRLSS